jgi:phosphate transport system substrate-binding protein
MPEIRMFTLVAALCATVTCMIPPPADAEGRSRISVVGSSTVYPFATAVAETFGRDGRWKTPVVESIGTGAGFKTFCRGIGLETADVVDASRPMTDNEQQSCAKHSVIGIVAIRIGSDGIIVATSRRVAAFELTRDQLYRAVARKVVLQGRLVDNPYRRWVDVDPRLPNRRISVLGPATNHGTRDAFAALVMTPPCEQHPEIRALAPEARREACQAVREDGAWTDVAADYSVLLGRLLDDREAVGIVTYSYLSQNRQAIRAVPLDGVAPSADSIASWKYPASRPLFIYVKTAHLGVIPGLADFLTEFVSDRAAGPDGYLVALGLAPMPPAWLELERARIKGLGPHPH